MFGTDISQQLDWAKKEAKKVSAIPLRSSLLAHIKEINKKADAHPDLTASRGVRLGGSYCLIARKSKDAQGKKEL